MVLGGMHFDQVWFVDFEFSAPPGERPTPICLVAHELGSQRVVRLWHDEIRRNIAPPYGSRSDLVIAFYASAEVGCHLTLGWPAPAYVLDLFAEFRNLTNRSDQPQGGSLLDAMAYFGLDSMDAVEKESMRQLAVRGGPWSPEERDALLQYCESDVQALEKLFGRMQQYIDLPRALLRGRYMIAAARMEHVGIPIDTTALSVLNQNWGGIKEKLVDRIDPQHEVYEGTTFKAEKFGTWLQSRSISWPRLASGQLNLQDETFKKMALLNPEVATIRELRESLAQLRLTKLAIGSDGRNRVPLSAFRSISGRNQPSNAKFVFGMPAWVRSLIRPEPDRAIAYIDWSQQEFGIAAALSGDVLMQRAYLSGDPYLTFAKQAGAIPPEATKATHPQQRELFKQCVLAVQYGMSAESLAQRIGRRITDARELLDLHRKTYSKFWRWSDGAVDYAVLNKRIHTTFGWTLHIGMKVKERSLRNFPMQANGAEMLRLACCLATEQDIRVCAPVHDAILIEARIHDAATVIEAAQAAMAEAARAVLNGFPLRSDAMIVQYPARFEDPRGRVMWNLVLGIIEESERDETKLTHWAGQNCDLTCA